MDNTRNEYNRKYCNKCYLTIKGIKYEQWTDNEDINIEDLRQKYPNYTFIRRKIDKCFYRIYRSIS
jgi:hypothetical protein